MSQQQALLMKELWEETERLRAEVDELQARLYMHAEAGAESAADEVLEDVWNVWPYTWAQSGWEQAQFFLADRLHSFQGKRYGGSLARYNRKAREAFAGAGHGEECALTAL